ncbi:unnamed protein product [Nesidiocoris tenuis]|uniref:Uncharacterized protein n=1 Tax=Nesidiocoris tenuis TaxID=355587 RepID=A0A6H5GVB7_9HEMI|nr:unnamed protein product [Nesidiocoris tenuis]
MVPGANLLSKLSELLCFQIDNFFPSDSLVRPICSPVILFQPMTCKGSIRFLPGRDEQCLSLLLLGYSGKHRRSAPLWTPHLLNRMKVSFVKHVKQMYINHWQWVIWECRLKFLNLSFILIQLPTYPFPKMPSHLVCCLWPAELSQPKSRYTNFGNDFDSQLAHHRSQLEDCINCFTGVVVDACRLWRNAAIGRYHAYDHVLMMTHIVGRAQESGDDSLLGSLGSFQELECGHKVGKKSIIQLPSSDNHTTLTLFLQPSETKIRRTLPAEAVPSLVTSEPSYFAENAHVSNSEVDFGEKLLNALLDAKTPSSRPVSMLVVIDLSFSTLDVHLAGPQSCTALTVEQLFAPGNCPKLAH